MNTNAKLQNISRQNPKLIRRIIYHGQLRSIPEIQVRFHIRKYINKNHHTNTIKNKQLDYFIHTEKEFHITQHLLLFHITTTCC